VCWLTRRLAAEGSTAHHRNPAHTVAQPRRARDNIRPFSKEEDYQASRAWRARGGWDDRLDPNCGPARSRYGF